MIIFNSVEFVLIRIFSCCFSMRNGEMPYNGLHMACGGFEALSCPPKPKLATERNPCWQPFTRHKLYAVLAPVFIFYIPIVFPLPYRKIVDCISLTLEFYLHFQI